MLRREYMRRGVTEDLLPAQFDPAFFAALNMALDQMPVQQPQAPMAMAGGGIASLAQYGRNGDTMLAHITPEEAALLKARGGAGTINPMTGLPEYANIFSSIGKAVKKFASSTVGKIVTTVALGFFLGPAAASMLGVTSSAGVAAVGGFLGGAGSTLLGGGSLKEALRAGAIGGLTAGAAQGITGGADAFTSGSYTGPTTVSGQFQRVSDFFSPSAAQSAAPTSLVEPGSAPTLADSRFGGEYVDPASRFGAEPPPVSARAMPAPAAPQATGTLDYLKQGEFGKAFESLTPSGISKAGEAAAQDAGMKAMEALQARLPSATPAMLEAEYQRVYQAAMPGMFAKYGPLAAATLGATALAGGFKTTPATLPLGLQETGDDYLRKYPERYRLAFGGLGPGTQRYNPYLPPLPPTNMAEGGIADLDKFPRKTGHIKGPGTGTSDSIPAMLSDGEFVFTAKAVRSVGNGSRRKGAKRLYKLMKALESNNVHN
jgi:hypothetical protein